MNVQMMRLTIERLRAGVVAGTLLLLMRRWAGVLLYAHYRAHGLLRASAVAAGYGYPEADGWRDVLADDQGPDGIYGACGEGDAAKGMARRSLRMRAWCCTGMADGRADRIYGKRFHYDQSAGVIRAMGRGAAGSGCCRRRWGAEERLRFASGAAIRARKAGKCSVERTCSSRFM